MWNRLRRIVMRWVWMKQYEKSLNDRAEVEQILLDVSRGVRHMLTPKECRMLAMKLGVPKEWRD